MDLSTTTVAVARTVAEQLSPRGIAFADAPVARTREAAQRGELSIMVGADEALYARIEPLLRYMGSDVTRCGGVGCGQVVKLVNNALVFENTVAIAEMMVLSERAGVPPAVLLDAVSKGSGDSFALRNHARKAMLPREFPEKSFPPEYVLKDIGYVLELAAQVGVSAHVTQLAQRYYAAAANNGWAGRYYPAVIEVVDRDIELPAQLLGGRAMLKLQGRVMATGLGFPEGPVALPDGSVLVVEIAGGRLTRVLPSGELGASSRTSAGGRTARPSVPTGTAMSATTAASIGARMMASRGRSARRPTTKAAASSG